MGCYVSTLGSAMDCSTPQTTMPRWLCGVFAVQITSLHNGLIMFYASVDTCMFCVCSYVFVVYTAQCPDENDAVRMRVREEAR